MADQNIIPLLLQVLAEEKQIDTAIAVEIEPESDWYGKWQYCSLNQMLNLPFCQRYDVALVNLLKHTPATAPHVIAQSLVRLRDLFAKKMMVIADVGFTPDLRALGFSQVLDIDTQDANVCIWQFNILNYKHVPDWFNSKFWANPENWNKFRW